MQGGTPLTARGTKGSGDGASSAVPEYEEGRITVVVRSRPFNEREYALKSSNCLDYAQGTTITIYENGVSSASAPRAQSEGAVGDDGEDGSKTARAAAAYGRVHAFTFDHAYDGAVPQERVYNDIGRPMLASSFRGFNTCIFAYGQTGSGKSYAMMGPSGGRDTGKDPGIIPRLCIELFQQMEEARRVNAKQREDAAAEGVEEHALPPKLVLHADVSYLEIYQEKVKCLLKPKKENLKVRQHPALGVYVEGLTEVTVETYEDVMQLMNVGNQGRHTAATNMNDRSSRSHAIFAIQLTQKRISTTKDGEETMTVLRSKMNLVDLAGSERAKSTGAEGDTLKEGAQINKSLTVLGLVISGLAEASKGRASSGSKQVFIPYRDSMLTYLLKESLGGNSKTFMISTLSPATVNYEETLSTLRYADRAKAIVTRACVNESAGDKRIRELEDEVTRLRDKIKHFQDMVQRQEEVSNLVPKLNFETVNAPKPWQREGKVPVGFRTGSSESNRISAAALNPRTAIDRIPTDSNYDGADDDFGREGSPTGEAETPRVPQDAARLEDQLRLAEEMIQSLSKSDQERDKESAALLEEYKAQSTVKVSRQEPYLLNVDGAGDWIMEHLVDEVTYLGKANLTQELVNSRCVIVSGNDVNGVGDQHCAFVKHEDGTVWLRPVEGYDTYLDDNDQPLQAETEIASGSTICIGEDFLQFKFIDPSAPSPPPARRRRQQQQQLQALQNKNLSHAEKTDAEQNIPSPANKHVSFSSGEGPSIPSTLPSQPSTGSPAPACEAQHSFKPSSATSPVEDQQSASAALEALAAPSLPSSSSSSEGPSLNERGGEKPRSANHADPEYGFDGSAGRGDSPAPIDPSAAAPGQSDGSASPSKLTIPPLQLVSPSPAKQSPQADQTSASQGREPRRDVSQNAPKHAGDVASQRERSQTARTGQSAAPPISSRGAVERGGSTAREGSKNRGPNGSSSVAVAPLRTFRNLNEDYVQSFRHSFIFLGKTRSGKTTLRENLPKQDKWLSFLTREKLEYRPTLGVESSRVQTGLMQQAEMPLVELSGNRCFDLLQDLLPQSRVTYVLCFNLVERATLHLFRATLEAILCQTARRDAGIMLVGTHRDLVRWSDKEIGQVLSDLETQVNDFLRVLQPNAEFRPTVVGRFAVSNVERTVFSPSAPRLSRFPEMLSWMGEHAVQCCRTDIDFPNCLVPSRLITLANKLSDLAASGKWCITSAEYKAVARAIDTRYTGNNEELHCHTQLLHSWGVVHHYFRHLSMRRHIILDMPWVMRVVAALCSCRRTSSEYTASELANAASGKNNAASDDEDGSFHDNALLDTAFIHSLGVWRAFTGKLPFSPNAVARADCGKLLNKGILTNATANELLKGVLREKKYSLSQLPGLLELMGSYDFLIMGSRVKLSSSVVNTSAAAHARTDLSLVGGSRRSSSSSASVHARRMDARRLSTNESGKDDEDELDEEGENGDDDDDDADYGEEEDVHENFYLIPSCFRGQPPSVFTVHLPDVLFGPFYRFKFNMVPPNFFSRFVARVAFYADKVYLGPIAQETIESAIELSASPSSSPREASSESRAAGTFPEAQRSIEAEVSDEEEQLWSNTAWVISSPTTRALLRMVHHTLLVAFHDHSDDEEFHDGLRHIVHNVIAESPGAVCEESLLCSTTLLDEDERALTSTVSGRILEETELEHSAGGGTNGDDPVLYWREIDDNINSLEKIREMENFALRTARASSARDYMDTRSLEARSGSDDSFLNELDADHGAGAAENVIIPFVRSREEPLNVHRVVSSITSESLMTDDIVHRVEKAVKLIAKGRNLDERNRGIMLEGKGIDELVDALAKA